MEEKFQLCFNSECPDIGTFETFVQEALVFYQIDDHYTVQDIIDQACQRCEDSSSPDAIVEIHISLLKSTCLEIIHKRSQAHHKDTLNQAVEVLFKGKDLSALRFLATVQRFLYQYGLSKAYAPKEIVAEAYLRGVQYITSGKQIEIPEAWLIRTCLNVIRELQRKQKQADNPNFDPEPWVPGDQALTELMQREDYEAVTLAMQRLSSEEHEILTLRVYQKKTWREIGAMLLNATGHPLGENAARQRGFRAFLRLRQHYNSIREDVRAPEDG